MCLSYLNSKGENVIGRKCCDVHQFISLFLQNINRRKYKNYRIIEESFKLRMKILKALYQNSRILHRF